MIKVSIWMDKPPQMMERQWRGILRASLSEMAAKWHSEVLPKHFTRAAPQKYGHQPRRPGYLRRKRRAATRAGTRHIQVKYGGMIDNVYSGDMERRLRQIGRVTASNYQTVTLTMAGPRYMTMRVFRGNRQEAFRKGWTYGKGKQFNPTAGIQPDKVREVTTQTADELHELTVFLNDRVAARWRAWKDRRKVV